VASGAVRLGHFYLRVRHWYLLAPAEAANEVLGLADYRIFADGHDFLPCCASPESVLTSIIAKL
jgi:hypothetical protein